MGLIAQALIKVKAIVILPLLVQYLSKDDLGSWRIISTAVSFLTPIITLNIFDGSGIFLSSDFENTSVSKKYSSIIFSVIVSGLLLSIPILIFLKNFSSTGKYWIEIGLYVIASIVLKAGLTPYQAYQKSKAIVFINFITEYGSALITVVFVLFIINDYKALLIPVIILQFTVGFVLLYLINNEFKIQFFYDFLFIKKVLWISIPLLPVYIGEWALASVSIYFLEQISGIKSVGIFSVAFSIASLFLSLRATLQYFWFSTATNLLQNNQIIKFEKIYRVVVKAYFLIIVLGTISYIYFTNYLILIFANNNFISATYTTIILGFSFGIFVFSGIFNGVLYALGKTKIIFFAYLAATLLSVVSNYWLIKLYGITGAAVSSFLGYSFLTILLFYKANKLLSINMKIFFNYTSLLGIVFIIISLVLKTFIIDDTQLLLAGIITIALFIMIIFQKNIIKLKHILEILKVYR